MPGTFTISEGARNAESGRPTLSLSWYVTVRRTSYYVRLMAECFEGLPIRIALP